MWILCWFSVVMLIELFYTTLAVARGFAHTLLPAYSLELSGLTQLHISEIIFKIALGFPNPYKQTNNQSYNFIYL